MRINSGDPSTGERIYGNVCIGQQRGYPPRPGIRLLVDIDDVEIYNNTFYGFGQGVMTEGGPITGVRMYNNIFAAVTANNLEIYSWTSPLTNYNGYAAPGAATAPRYIYPGGNYGSLTDYQTASGLDADSREIDCQFVEPPRDLHLAAGSRCSGAGRVGGVADGAPIDLGALARDWTSHPAAHRRTPASMTQTPEPLARASGARPASPPAEDARSSRHRPATRPVRCCRCSPRRLASPGSRSGGAMGTSELRLGGLVSLRLFAGRRGRLWSWRSDPSCETSFSGCRQRTAKSWRRDCTTAS